MSGDDATPNRFALRSGERQVATDLGGVRRDHLLRYQWMADSWPHYHKSPPAFGADVFCGIGYGSALLSQTLGCRMLGIDGSPEAILWAEEHFPSPRLLFAAKYFPFELPQHTFDLICLLESVEHVPEPGRLFAEAARALKPGGLLVLSTPNSDQLSLVVNPNPFHCRHFTPEEVTEMIEQGPVPMEILERRHQNVYLMENRKAVATLPEEQHSLQPGPDGQFTLCLMRRKGVRRRLFSFPG